jgi:CRISPR-associated protein Cas1
VAILLNTLYVTTQGAYVGKDGEAVVVRADGAVVLRVPIHHLAGIVCFGQVSCSPAIMHACAEADVAISFLSESGRFLARVQGPVSGNVLLRREQYRRADDPAGTASLARAIVAGKIVNARTVLRRAARDHADTPGAAAIAEAADQLGGTLARLRGTHEVERIRGIEGEAAKLYFSVFDHLITAQKTAFTFNGRSRRPPMDRVNALLSFVYTLLLHDVRAALESVGLDPAVGYLHRDRPGRPGLALDLMEEFRSWLADRLVLSLINRQQVTGDGFSVEDGGAVTMDAGTRKTVLSAWQERKREEITHPFLEERMTVALALQVQARLFARHLRGDVDAYPPFVWR